MNHQYVSSPEGYLALLADSYFHQDWGFEHLSPCEVIRTLILWYAKDGDFLLIPSMSDIESRYHDDKLIEDMIRRLGFQLVPQAYEMKPLAFWQDMIDIAKYVAIKEVGCDYGAYLKERGEPLLSENEVGKKAAKEYPYLYETINECLTKDCIIEQDVGYSQFIRSYFFVQNEQKKLAIHKELKDVYRRYEDAYVLNDFLVNSLGMRYNLSYYSMPPRMLIRVLADLLYFTLPPDKRIPLGS